MNTSTIAMATALAAFSLSAAQAVIITPTYDTFGPLLAATFGGSGIPNSSVAITNTTVGNNTITMGLTAHQRFANPVVTNDGAGTFSAVSGGDTPATYARWNFGFYVDVAGPRPAFFPIDAVLGTSLRFFYDTNPAVGNDVDTSIDLPFVFDLQDSYNLGFNFLGDTNGISFDPDAAGEYSFALALYNSAGAEIDRAAINVNVARPDGVPVTEGGATLALAGLALLGVSGLQRMVGRRPAAHV